MTYLPNPPYKGSLMKKTQASFGGYNHVLGAEDGQLYDMANLTSDYPPLIATRGRRYLVEKLEEGNGLFARDALMWVDGTGFYYNGEEKGQVEDGRKTFCSMGTYVIIMPDKAYYNTATDSFGSLESSYQGAAGEIYFDDGTIFGEAAEGCALVTRGAPFDFSVGDAVTISGCVTLPENNKTPIIREISEDKKTLTFYEFTFTTGEEAGAVLVSRTVPDMDYLCECDNRLWGCKGDTIYGSKLGDPKNFNVFDGISTDSYAVDVGSGGDFTAAFNYLGRPTFFKEDTIHKVYGSKPTNYEVMSSANLGVAYGSSDSLAVAGEILFYLSRTGMVAYTGGIPQSINENFGMVRYKNGVGGSDGIKYYVSMQDDEGEYHLFVYDTRTKIWHREDNTEVLNFGFYNGLHMLTSLGEIWTCRVQPETFLEEEDKVEWYVEFSDFTEYYPDKKGLSSLQFRLELDEGAKVSAYLRLDSEEGMTHVKTIKAEKKRSYTLPIRPKRGDHYKIILKGVGQCYIYSLSREYYQGSSQHTGR